MKRLLFIFITLTAMILTGCDSTTVKDTYNPPVENPDTGDTTDPGDTTNPPKPEILGTTSITSIHGETIKVFKTAEGFIFEGYEDKVVLLEVYGDTCPHCVDAIPSYNNLQAKYPDDVVIIAIESYGTLSNAGLQQYITIPRANSGKMYTYIRELTGYNLQAVPYLMIMSRDGGIVYDKILANFPYNEIDSLIQQLL